MRRGPSPFIILACLAAAGLVLSALVTPIRPHPQLDEPNLTSLHMDEIGAASEWYNRTYGMWPTGLIQLSAQHNDQHIDFLVPDHNATNDGWGRPILYRPFDPALGYGTTLSLGRDGKPGGTGKNADIEQRFH
jgi:hypothetical protein